MVELGDTGLEISIQAVAVLTIIAIASAASLAALHNLTQPRIEESRKERRESTLEKIFPSGEFEELENDVYKVTRDGSLVGYAGIGKGKGYGGFSGGLIHMAVGINLDGTVHGVKVIRQSETPGLGSRITNEGFLKKFDNLSLGDIKLERNGGDVKALTGATISSSAAVDIVREQVEKLNSYLSEG